MMKFLQVVLVFTLSVECIGQSTAAVLINEYSSLVDQLDSQGANPQPSTITEYDVFFKGKLEPRLPDLANEICAKQSNKLAEQFIVAASKDAGNACEALWMTYTKVFLCKMDVVSAQIEQSPYKAFLIEMVQFSLEELEGSDEHTAQELEEARKRFHSLE